jgi:hypothetical protein
MLSPLPFNPASPLSAHRQVRVSLGRVIYGAAILQEGRDQLSHGLEALQRLSVLSAADLYKVLAALHGLNRAVESSECRASRGLK